MAKRIPARKAPPRPARAPRDTTLRKPGHRYDGKYHRGSQNN